MSTYLADVIGVNLDLNTPNSSSSAYSSPSAVIRSTISFYFTDVNLCKAPRRMYRIPRGQHRSLGLPDSGIAIISLKDATMLAVMPASCRARRRLVVTSIAWDNGVDDITAQRQHPVIHLSSHVFTILNRLHALFVTHYP